MICKCKGHCVDNGILGEIVCMLALNSYYRQVDTNYVY